MAGTGVAKAAGTTTSADAEPAAQPRVTLPALRHEVHTVTFLGVPFSTVRTVWTLGFQRRLVRRWE